ncbi:hypothetical protein CHARACLAT_022097 [Characodon lateralis]|uniref:Uncharacterized protein n=1 Tax=Characodon lateralis TaxID=208331 RepID=A0ABU7E425_9TELE|nr:hypothetical protein [Characodon lateralis]
MLKALEMVDEPPQCHMENWNISFYSLLKWDRFRIQGELESTGDVCFLDLLPRLLDLRKTDDNRQKVNDFQKQFICWSLYLDLSMVLGLCSSLISKHTKDGVCF